MQNVSCLQLGVIPYCRGRKFANFAKFTCRIPNLFDDNSRRVLHVPTNRGDFPGRNQFRLNLDEEVADISPTLMLLPLLCGRNRDQYSQR